ncbi:hypothetical protein [Streptomyces doebereineriae]|uniref:Uncharacterized protein n=1 Tax=Streptomyces doebereineriae TaxID=3075528 RepID=A0ABU2VB13_9ACTN|nr:hypothetical protein [Streptomyces sp. DSM 41640]MDT0482624.1 hypothetical protein [Streptomyces sp. DSM 41640]
MHIKMRQDKIALPIPPSDAPSQVSWLLRNDGPGVAKDVTISMDLTNVKSWLIVNRKLLTTSTHGPPSRRLPRAIPPAASRTSTPSPARRAAPPAR